MSYGRLLKEFRPGDFPQTEEELDAKAEQHLSGPTRAEFLASNRQMFPKMADLDDDALAGVIKAEIDKSRASRQATYSDEELRENKVYSAQKDAQDMRAQLFRREQSVRDAGEMTPARESHYTEAARNVATPASVKDPISIGGESINISKSNLARFPTIGRWDKESDTNPGMLQMVKKWRDQKYDPVIVRPDGFGQPVIAIDRETKDLLGVLDPMASYDATPDFTGDKPVVQGSTWDDALLFGPASMLQNTMGNLVGAASDLVSGKPTQWRKGYGIREAVGDIGEKFPEAGLGAAQDFSRAKEAAAKAALLSSQAPVPGQIRLPANAPPSAYGNPPEWSKVTQEDRAAALQSQDELAKIPAQEQAFRDYVRTAEPDVQEEIGRMGGETVGELAGLAASMQTPGDIYPAVGAASKLAKVPAVAKALDRLRTGAGEMVPDAVKDFVSQTPAATFEASGIPVAPGVESTRDALRLASNTRKNAPTIEATAHAEDLTAKMAAVLKKHGITDPDQQRQARMAMQDVINDPRKWDEQPAAVQELLDVYVPADLAAYRKVKSATGRQSLHDEVAARSLAWRDKLEQQAAAQGMDVAELQSAFEHGIDVEEMAKKDPAFALHRNTKRLMDRLNTISRAGEKNIEKVSAESSKMLEDISDAIARGDRKAIADIIKGKITLSPSRITEYQSLSEALSDAIAERRMRLIADIDGRVQRASMSTERALTETENRFLRGIPVRDRDALRNKARIWWASGQDPYKLSSWYQQKFAQTGMSELDALRKATKFAEENETAWNPAHVARGQNPYKKAEKLRTAEAQGREAMGEVLIPGERISASEIKDKPGIRMLSAVDREAMRAQVLPSKEKQASAVEEWLLSNGESPARAEMEGKIARTTDPIVGQYVAMESGLRTKKYHVQQAANVLRNHYERAAQARKAGEPFQYGSLGEFTEYVRSKTPTGIGTVKSRTAAGDIREAGKTYLDANREKELREHGLVVIRVRPDKSERLLRGGAEVTLGPEWSYFDKKVVPRALAKGMQDISSPNWTGKPQAFAQAMDWWLGLAQKKALITSANPGFWRRNEVSNLMRVYGYGGREALKGENLDIVKKIMSAKMGDRSGPMLKIGDQSLPAGEWRKVFATQFGSGTSLPQDMSQAADTGGHLFSEPIHLLGGGQSRAYKIARGYEKGRDAIINAMRVPGETLGKAGEHAWVSGVPGSYSFDDLLKMTVAIHDMKQGSNVVAASQAAKNLLVDYNSTSQMEYALGPFVPFVKYWTRMVPGIAMAVNKNPKAYRRVRDLMVSEEGFDAQQEGGSFDPRLKTPMARYMMAPWVTAANRTNEARFESPISETVNVIGQLTGSDPGKSPLGLFGPIVSETYKGVTGKDISSGRHIMGLKPSDIISATPADSAYPYSLSLRNILSAYNAGRLGSFEDAVKLAALELGGGYASAPAMAIARYVLNSMSASTRTEEDRSNAAGRTAIRQLSGLGVQPVDSRAVMVKAMRDVLESTSGPDERRDKQMIKRGIKPPPRRTP